MDANSTKRMRPSEVVGDPATAQLEKNRLLAIERREEGLNLIKELTSKDLSPEENVDYEIKEYSKATISKFYAPKLKPGQINPKASCYLYIKHAKEFTLVSDISKEALEKRGYSLTPSRELLFVGQKIRKFKKLSIKPEADSEDEEDEEEDNETEASKKFEYDIVSLTIPAKDTKGNWYLNVEWSGVWFPVDVLSENVLYKKEFLAYYKQHKNALHLDQYLEMVNTWKDFKNGVDKDKMEIKPTVDSFEEDSDASTDQKVVDSGSTQNVNVPIAPKNQSASTRTAIWAAPWKRDSTSTITSNLASACATVDAASSSTGNSTFSNENPELLAKEQAMPKRKRGRPPGSRNKSKQTSNSDISSYQSFFPTPKTTSLSASTWTPASKSTWTPAMASNDASSSDENSDADVKSTRMDHSDSSTKRKSTKGKPNQSFTAFQPNASICTQENVPLVHPRARFIGPVVRIFKRDQPLLNDPNGPYYRTQVKRPFDYELLNRQLLVDSKSPSNKQIFRASSSATSHSSQLKKMIDKMENTSAKNWRCSVCHKGPNVESLGDLYGPYDVDVQVNPDQEPTPEHCKVAVAVSKIKSRFNQQNAPRVASRYEPVEHWFHEDCIVWLPNVVLMDGELVNIREAMEEACATKCVHCNRSGASIGCFDKTCALKALHFPCAKHLRCYFDETRFSVICKDHIDMFKADPRYNKQPMSLQLYHF